MCILFLYVAKKLANPSSQSEGLIKLVIASNRDESYSRRTIPAKFWDSDPNILAGQDCQEGGTWLGISKTGKLAVLLNILSKAPVPKLKSRGGLVTGFLRSDPALRGWTYCNNLHQVDIRKNYGLFNLITIDLQPSPTEKRKTQSLPETSSSSSSLTTESSFDVTYFTNGSDNEPRILSEEEGESEFYAFGNSVYDSPFCKVQNACREFEDILNSCDSKSTTLLNQKETLKGKLLNLLKSSTRYFPDPQIEKQAHYAGGRISIPELTSVFVTSETMNYGTRTHTVLIIDSEDNVNYHEWTMEEPINIKNPKWIESQYNFKIEK